MGTSIFQIATIPALFVILAALLITHSADSDRIHRRYLLYFLVVGTLMLAVMVMADQISSEQGNWSLLQIGGLLTPALIGVLAFSILQLRAAAKMRQSTRIGVVVLVLAQVACLYLLRDSRLEIGYLILPNVALLVIGWAVGNRNPWLAVILSLIILAGLWLMYQSSFNPPPEPTNDGIRFSLQWAFYSIPALIIVMPAVLLTTALRPAKNRSRWTQVILRGLACVLPIFPAYTIYWGSVWDQTSDGLFGIAIAQPASIVAVGAGMLMVLALRGRYRLIGLGFMIVMPVIPFQAMQLGRQADYHAITEERADQIALAVDQYKTREGYYPAALTDLTPRDIGYIEQPMILVGETWCYQGGADYYRLGAFYREYFSSPVSLHIYDSAGEPPTQGWDCDGREAAVLEHYPAPDNPAAFQPPQPTALPSSELDFPKTAVEPVLGGIATAVGSWSPDSAYFFFGAQSSDNTTTLHFLDGATGEVCDAAGQFTLVTELRSRHAWLPDGRLFFVNYDGQVVLLTPCTDEVTDITDRLKAAITDIRAYAPETGRLLLQGNSAYWILDAKTLNMQQIEGVVPNPNDLHWDQFTWLPGGNQVVISHLNGHDRTEGSTLYLIAGETGQVVNSLALDLASDQSAPFIEPLIDQQIILSGEGDLLIVDLGTSPAAVTNVMADIFKLDIDYPNEMSSAGWYTEAGGQGYYLVMRLNHPRNKALYWYHSTDNSITTVDNNRSTLVLLPDNQLWDMSPWEDQPSYQDTYDVITLASGASTVVKFPGHVPRNYPRLSFKYLAPTAQIAVASSQGVALHEVTDGAMNRFWDVSGDGYAPALLVSPDGASLIAAKDYGPLYWLRP
jgi:hypothetical protein